MMYSHFPIAVILVVLLLAIPVILIAIKHSVFRSFSLSGLTRVLNKAFLFQVLIGLAITIGTVVMNKTVNWDEDENTVAAIFIETAYTYVVIGAFMYFPGLVLINLITWIVNKLIQSK